MKRHRYKFAHGKQRVLEFEIGPWVITFERSVGVYGYENTVSYAVRWWKR